jgi:hypothetical protein
MRLKTYSRKEIVPSASENRDLGRIVLQLGALAGQAMVTAQVAPAQTVSSENSKLIDVKQTTRPV